MNEQELLMRKKQEKREKVDTILAYIMLVVLLTIIAFVVYLKFFRKNDQVVEKPNNTPNYITITNITNSLNASELVRGYLSEGATFNATPLTSGISIKYEKGNDALNFDIPQIGNELSITIDSQNEKVATDLYQEIATVICNYYGGSRSACSNVIKNISDANPLDGIRIDENANTKTVYLDITKKIDVSNATLTYNEKTIVDIENSNKYILVMNDTRVTDLKVEKLDNSVKLSGMIYNLMTNGVSLDILFTVYDENNNEIKNNRLSFDATNPLVDSNNFDIAIELDNTENVDNVKKYSIEIIKNSEE